MVKFHTLIILACLLTLEVTVADKTVSIELEGTFRSEFSEFDTHAGLSFNVQENGRSKRENRQLPPAYFTGKLTINSNNEKFVVGVNSTFEYVLLDSEVIEDGSNRVKREASNKTRVGLYGQFTLGRRSKVLRVRINWDVEEVSAVLDPYTGESSGEFLEAMEFGFKGSLTATKEGAEDAILNFAVNFGFEEKPRATTHIDNDNGGSDGSSNRNKREEPVVATLKLVGELTVKQGLGSGRTFTSVDSIDGEAIFDLTADGPSPKAEFFANAGANHALIETEGNITGTMHGLPMFKYPVATSTRVHVNDKRAKRSAPENLIWGLEYNGVVSTFTHTNRIDKLGVSSRSTFWLISRERQQRNP